MKSVLKIAAYQAGCYHKIRPDVADMAEQYVSLAEKSHQAWSAQKGALPVMPPTICFSRKIGVGALEVADGLANKLGARVADRLIIEHIADSAALKEKTIRFFDERYPGKIAELGAFLFGEKSFVMSNYVRALFIAIYTLAETGLTIFVGRGAHLVLPRDRVLAVRLICSKSYRIDRLSKMYTLSYAEAEKKLDEVDEEQRSFFKKIFKRKDASPYEFDLVLNMDFLQNPGWAVEIIHTAFRTKFKTEQ